MCFSGFILVMNVLSIYCYIGSSYEDWSVGCYKSYECYRGRFLLICETVLYLNTKEKETHFYNQL